MKGKVIDSATLNMNKLCIFFSNQIRKAKDENLLFSLHMKATMMKVSDPIIFGKCVEVFYASIFDKYSQLLNQAGVDVNNGSGNLFSKKSNNIVVKSGQTISGRISKPKK